MGNQELKKRCIIIAGSPECDLKFISNIVSDDDFVICADKGLNYALQAGIKPSIVIGDFDSYSGDSQYKYKVVTLPVHKDETDAMHSAYYALKQGYKKITILCATGGRLDHTYGNLATLQYIAERGGKGELLSPYERILFLPTGHYEFDNLKGRTFSMFPYGCGRVLVSNSGMEYPLDRVYIESSVTLGISNVFISDKSSVDIYDGNAIIIMNLKEV